MRALQRKAKTNRERRYRRKLRGRSKVSGTTDRPRLVVFRSLKHTYAQLVDDTTSTTLVGVNDRSRGLAPDGDTKTARSLAVGKLIAERAKEKGITRVVFDRAGYKYHGRVKAVADGARQGGLEF